MSPEINGNPPSVTKRKKNKKPSTGSSNTSASAFDLNASMSNNCNSFYSGSSPYHNLSIPDISNYYSFVNYSNTSTEPMSLPIFPNLGYHPPPHTAPYIPPPTNFLGNFSTPKPGTLPANFLNNDSNSEYLSLPVVNPDQNDDESKRRYSDPGLPNDSDSSSNSYDERLVQKLYQQVNILRESNKRLQREVIELRFEVNMLKSQSFRHYEREYEPGMLADIIREVRDAARVREDALLARVKHMIEEKQMSMNHLHLVSEKNRNNDRITKLEDQLKNLTVNPSRLSDHASTSATINSNSDDGPSSARQVLELEQEALELRRELQDARAKKEEADHKYLQLDKKLTSILRRNDISTSDTISEDGKTGSIDSCNLSITTTASSISQVPTRVILSGPVTDL